MGDAYQKKVEALADSIMAEKANIRKRREQREKRTATVEAIMANAKSEAEKQVQSVRIIIHDPDTARLVRRAVAIFAAMMRARAN
jgi:hypothetical protein